VPVADPGEPLVNEDGIVGRTHVKRQLLAAAEIIRDRRPAKIVMLGGDCLVDLAPFAHLLELYGDDLGILWVDAHPDVMTPAQYPHSHAHVLGALMGNGDPDLTSGVSRPVSPSKVMIAGIDEPLEYEAQFIADHGIRTAPPEALRGGAGPILEWINQEHISKLAVHFDVDVLNYRTFRSVLFARPDVGEHEYDGIAKGYLELAEAVAINQAVAAAEVVGLGIAEHLPWDAINLKRALEQLPLLRRDTRK
jgi:arginase